MCTLSLGIITHLLIMYIPKAPFQISTVPRDSGPNCEFYRTLYYQTILSRNVLHWTLGSKDFQQRLRHRHKFHLERRVYQLKHGAYTRGYVGFSTYDRRERVLVRPWVGDHCQIPDIFIYYSPSPPYFYQFVLTMTPGAAKACSGFEPEADQISVGALWYNNASSALQE